MKGREEKMNAKERKVFDEIEKRFSEENGKSDKYFTSVIMRIHYKGYETRIRFDEHSRLYWAKIDNAHVRIEFMDKKLETIIKRFIKEVDNRKELQY